MSASVSAIEAAEGTCIQLGDGSDLWAVRGRAGWYRIDNSRGVCNCGDWMYRQARTLTPCRHQRMLGQYLLAAVMVRGLFEAITAAEAERPLLPSEAELRDLFA